MESRETDGTGTNEMARDRSSQNLTATEVEQESEQLATEAGDADEEDDLFGAF